MHDNNSPLAIRAEHLSKTYLLYERPQDRLRQFLCRGRRRYFTEVQALKDVSFTVGRGEAVGIVGRNGSGKSTLLQMLCGIITPTAGELGVEGRISALLELGAGFNPEFTGRENVTLNAAILGIGRDAIAAKFDEIAAFAAIGPFMDQPVKTYSSGMYIRLAFAVSVATEPDILIVDEALAVGDEAFQRKCYARIHRLKQQGTTILFVSHASQTVIELCDRALLIDQGELLLDGEPKRVISQYHKLIYADPAKQQAVRDDIRRQDAAVSSAPLLDAALAPESRIEYPAGGAQISHPRITTLKGEETNLLRCGDKYQYRFIVTAQEDTTRMKFGMLIKTKTGLHLGGAGGAGEEHLYPLLRAGESLEVIFTFRCLMRGGTYFMNCGCTREESGEDIFVHRIIDAYQFRVLEEGDDSPTQAKGMIDFGITAQLLPITADILNAQTAL